MKNTQKLFTRNFISGLILSIFLSLGASQANAESANCKQICDFYTNCLPVIFSTPEYKAKLKKTKKKDMRSCMKTCKKKSGKDSLSSCYTGDASNMNSCKTFYVCAVKYFKK